MLPQPVTARIDGRQLAWREAGSGRPLVLVHGIGTDSRLWEPQFTAFAPRYRVIAWDAPGYGASDGFRDTPAAGDYAAALESLMRHLGIVSPHLVGHSLGAVMVAALCGRGVAAQSVTLMHPVAGAGRMEAGKREQLRAARINDMRTLGPAGFAQARGGAILGKAMPEDARRNAIANMAQVSADGYLQAWEMMCGADLFAELRHVVAPALVLCGLDDPVAPLKSCQEIAAQLGAPLKTFEGVGHSLPAEAPALLNETLAAFLAANEPAT
jgi:pimeloyl-ACP methyl ester carboxylesterase